MKITHDAIQELLKATCGLVIVKSTIINMISNVSDLMETEAKTITNTVMQSQFVNIDEISYILNGLMVWAWTIAYEKNITIIMKRCGAHVMDAYMDKFDGFAVTDGYLAYKRFDPGGMYQRCWVHELWIVKHMAVKHGGTHPRLYENLCILFNDAKNNIHGGASVRHAFEYTLDVMLDKYRSTEMSKMQSLIKRLENATMNLLAFIEHENITPTNNVAERALRDVMVWRKISGLIRGSESMRRMSNFLTCVLTWRSHDKIVFEDVFSIV